MGVRVALAALVSALLAVGVVAGSPVSAAGGPTVSVGDQSGLERDVVNGSVFVPVFLSEPAAEPVVVSFYTVDGTAVAGVDYARWGTPARPRMITIPAGQVQGQVNVPVLADGLVESDETFSVVLSGVSGGDAVIGDDTGVATIVDADGVSVDNPAITVSSPTVVEGDAGQRRAQFLVHLSRAPLTNVTITYATVDGTAVAGEDYVAKLPGTVVFAPGQISKSVDVLVNSNTVGDGDRAFSLDVSVTGGSPVEELTMAGVATIIDDDAAEPAPLGAVAIDAGASQTCVVMSSGSVKCWGDNTFGQLGDGTTTDSATPIDVADVSGATDVAVGRDHACALVAGGTVRCWGSNFYGQLGDGSVDDSLAPVEVTSVSGATSVVAGSHHTCALLSDGAVTCWGRNHRRQLADGTTTDSSLAVTAAGVAGATSISAAIGNHSCAAVAGGALRCWGDNSQGQMGVGTIANSSEPVNATDISGAIAVGAGGGGSCAVIAAGAMRCSGNNFSGQLGDGTNTSSSTAVAVSGLTGATALTVASNHACAVVAAGAVKCWGNGGKLGDGTVTNSNVPVDAVGVLGATRVAAGFNHTCALLSDGRVTCWGQNSEGQLGDGTTTASLTPVDVIGLGTTP